MVRSMKFNAVLNAIKQLLAVIFPLITVPYASRILQKANYGKINFSSSIVNYIVLIAALGISTYAIREGASIRNEKKKLSKFQNEVFTINIYSTLLSYLILIALLMFSVSLKEYRLLMIIQSIHEDYLFITVRYIVVQIISIICLFLFVKDTNDYVIYAMISTFSSVGGNVFNIIYIRKKYAHLRLVKECNFKKHMKPIMLLFCNAIAITIYVNSDTTILGFFKGDGAVGIYAIAAKLYTVVKQVLNAVVGITLPRFSSYVGQEDENSFSKLLKKVLDAQIVILFPCIIGLFMLSKEAILLVAGMEYSEGAVALRILSVALGFAVLACFYCNCILLPNKKEKICLIASIISAIINIVLNFLAIPWLSFNGAALTTLISEAVVFCIYWFYGRTIQRTQVSKKTIVTTGLGCCFICLICAVSKLLLDNYLLVIFVSVALSGIIYVAILILFKNELIMSLLYNLKNKSKVS